MFKQCCGCKGRPVDDGPDVDDGGKKPVEEKRGSLKKDAVEKKDSLKKDVVEKKDSLKKDVVEKKDSLKKDVVEKRDSLKKDAVEKKDSLNKEAEVPMVEVVKAPESPAQVKLPETPKKSEEPQKENKKPGLTIDTNPDLDNLEEEDETVVVPITPRTAKGLTPHPTKRNSTPGLSVIPKWLSQDDDEEGGGTAEPPVTPVGRDELALRRHRFFSDLLVAAQAATEHRVRFDPLGPSVAGEPAQASLLPSPAAELNTLLTRLENVTTRLEQATAESPGFLSHSNSSSQVTFSLPPQSAADMSSQAFEDIISGSLAAYVNLSNKIGSDVAAHAKLVSEAFQHQLQYLRLAETRTAPSAAEQAQLLQPTSQKIQDIQTLREKSRTSPFFNHLSAISESIPALGWVTVSPAPAPYIKEMNDAGQFYTNRVLKDWKQKDVTHVNWTKAWVETLTELQAFVKQKHTTGLVWAKTGSGPPPPPPGGMPPPPPVLPPLDSLSLDNSNDRSALFAEINRGEDVTKSLKKVTSDMQTHKNPGLRTGPAPFKAAAGSGGAPATTPVKAPPSNKPPVFARDGKKWLVEHQRGNKTLVVEGAEMNNVVYMYGCLDSTLTVKGKINSIFLDSCRKSAIVFDSLVSSVEFVNCQSVQMQVLGKVPTISIDKTDGCQMYLSQESMAVEIVSSKSSEMNVLVPKGNGDFAEFPIPEQYKTTVSSKGLTTTAVESAG